MFPFTKPRKRRISLIEILAVLILLLALALYRSNCTLQVEWFERSFSDLPAAFDGLTILHLSDLHGAEFGEGNADLIEKAAETAPDIIVITGDLIDHRQEDAEAYLNAIAPALVQIAPTYFVTGNHEGARGDIREVKQLLRGHGVTVLTNEAYTLSLNDESIVLAGIDDPNAFADQKTPQEFAAEVEAVDPFWILLAHRNTLFAEIYSTLGADLILSGHGHGGVIRLPFTDGLISTERTFFPDYTSGFYEANGSTLFVSRGLGNSSGAFRLFNRPQLAVLTLRRG